MIKHVFKRERKAAQQLIKELHYSGSSGNSGRLFAAMVAGAPVGGCLLGPTLSASSERSIIAEGYTCVLMKRLVATESCPYPESQIMRHAMRAVADMIGPYLCLSYADSVAVDARFDPPRPLLGAVYATAGMMLAGYTSQPRFAVVDDFGVLRSTRQGKVTLTAKTMPKKGSEWQGRIVTADWKKIRIPPARVWLTPVVPWHHNGKPTTRRERKHWYLDFWKNINPARRIAAQRWIDRHEWKRLLDLATVAELEPPRQQTEHQLLARALWPGYLITRTAGPVWVPQQEHGQLYMWPDVQGEVTSGRRYWPRGEASDI